MVTRVFQFGLVKAHRDSLQHPGITSTMEGLPGRFIYDPTLPVVRFIRGSRPESHRMGRQTSLSMSNGGGPRISIPPFRSADARTRAKSTGADVSSSRVAGSLAPR